MFKRKTLFILGAGSSVDAAPDFPTGLRLAEMVARLVDFRTDSGGLNLTSGDKVLFANLTHKQRHDLNELQMAAWRIRDGITLSESIDDFLHIRRDDSRMQVVGKAAIARLILAAERQSPLFIKPGGGTQSLNLAALKDSWLVKLMRMLSAGSTNVENIFDSVGFIIFNYDRCLEFFLFHALQQQYGIGAEESARLLQKLTLIHPYGQIGKLRTNWNSRDGIPFGGLGEHHDDYLSLSHSIKTYTEELADTSERDRMRGEIASAQCVVFLGFGFHEPNMRLLRSENPYSYRPVFGTALGVSESNADSVGQTLFSMFEHVSRMNDGKYGSITVARQTTCSQLLNDYQRAILGA